jgi:putative chitinase
MKITLELLKELCPTTSEKTLKLYVEPFNTVAEHYDMFDNPNRIAAFLAQTAHESANFTATKENLNYGAAGLMSTFKKYFPTQELANKYARQPAKIASRVYANRMGNSDEASQEGYKYCGRGLIQLTGKTNYTRFAKDLGMSIADTIKFLETPNGAVSSAGWFWDQNNLNKFCDAGDFTTLTKRINGGTNGMDDRLKKYNLAIDLLNN